MDEEEGEERREAMKDGIDGDKEKIRDKRLINAWGKNGQMERKGNRRKRKIKGERR